MSTLIRALTAQNTVKKSIYVQDKTIYASVLLMLHSPKSLSKFYQGQCLFHNEIFL